MEAQSKPLDNAMVVDEPAKPVAGLSKHLDDVDVIDGELIDWFTQPLPITVDGSSS